jgi:hypothetical protein
MRAIKKTVEKHKRESNAGRYVRRLKLKDGEFARGRFLGDDVTGMHESVEHSIRDGKMFDSVVCAGEGKCVLCHANSIGDKRVGRATPKFSFSFFDFRWVKKTRNEKESRKAGRDKFDYEVVDDDDVTPAGIRKGIYKRQGVVACEFPSTHATGLEGVNAQAGRKCKSCGKGKISVDGYEDKNGKPCSKKAAAMEEEELNDALDAGVIKEVISCSKCDDPERVSIFNSVVQVGRTGVEIKTSYQFSVDATEDFPEDVEWDKVEPIDFAAIKVPRSQEALAAKLGIKNPFKKKAKSKDDDEDEEDEEDDFEDYEDDEEEADEDSVFGEDDDEDSDDKDSDEDEEEDDEEEPRPRRKAKKSKKRGG